MAVRGLKFSMVSVVLTTILVLSYLSAAAKANADPEMKQCMRRCKHQESLTEKQQEECEQRCEGYYKMKGEFGRKGRGSSRGDEDYGSTQLKECQKHCERQQGSHQQKQDCRTRCEERLEEKETKPWSREEEWGRQAGKRREEKEEESSEEVLEEEQNPYVFQMEDFTTKAQSEHGRMRALPRFTKRSKLLEGIDNFRLVTVEANPQTFVIMNHWDADAVLFVVSGLGTLVMILENKRQAINIEMGDIVWAPAGTPGYLTSRDENEQLYIAKLLRPVNTPGHFEVFHGAGGQNPQSFYTTFSSEILEAALKTGRDKLERLFNQQQQGPIVKASREQVEALSEHDEGGMRRWPFGGETEGSRSYSFNIFSKRPSESNQYGQLLMAGMSDLKHLKEIDLMVSFANISRGSMTALYFNSRATKIAMVVDGTGYFEMACPHLSSGRESQDRERLWQTTDPTAYQKVRARLNRGTVFIVPAGHPFTAVASRNSNLQLVSFEVNAENNDIHMLAGKRNIVSLMQREAKELAFDFPAREVDRIFKSQEEEFFFPGPTRDEEVIRRYGDA
ncbi:hypothetical protein SAY86_025844 [Trapa natans]|uniref:Cupin type-1 domain-containing protein n=1 Tax=Trapa natans TaxID=22666 RepID=A0AAN7KCR7_TRANT|nr:hypothetical protein SAY86_025844 [Trapa natans]